jgi:hypothetical protein
MSSYDAGPNSGLTVFVVWLFGPARSGDFILGLVHPRYRSGTSCEELDQQIADSFYETTGHKMVRVVTGP